MQQVDDYQETILWGNAAQEWLNLDERNKVKSLKDDKVAVENVKVKKVKIEINVNLKRAAEHSKALLKKKQHTKT